ncbi:XRE family transcriptional regulator [Heyndrickxia sporothermodurans]|uniref:spr1629 family repressor/antitoxin n=1 Tax=Heyndrickxia sporothermodurans TaxID=46224 RepID=UPI002DB78A96|nr:XRE family transcriptional regulator [Heyndrickxia sporothermodurans]MEB6551491.1 XRE family transcriptional regulator [Heyndrickxia sporothermodurans]MED3652772.1 XRE family transcriptional regulator [Heyndrickxia sporothermodurans]MED3654299.1 XRE family transcriptional regulator [Heyndrickxia sporothermodurans]MED3697494.1 XRE family transcriptional regulator [Heyndrickxia sporothermodurans]
MFVGSNLTNIRILHGYTRKQLAEMLKITEQSVWQYENGYMSPKMEVVNELKKIFKVKSKYFYSEDFLDKNGKKVVHQSHIAYRAKEINSTHKTVCEAKHVEYLSTFLNIIEEKIQYPKNEIITLREKVIKYIMNSQEEYKTKIEQVAKLARDSLGMSNQSNMNLLFLLEKKGIFIFEKSIGDKIDAYSLWTEDDRPFIILGNLKKSASRRNFDLAHELGHLLLHYKVEFTSLDSKTHKQYEQEANLFAGAFLLPVEEFVKDFNSLHKNSNPISYIDLKRKWTVSIQALAYRAHYLGLLDYQKYRYFNIKLNQMGYKVQEPLDDQIKIMRPGKIRSILQLLFDKKYLSLSKLLDRLLVDIEFISNLVGIEVTFFKKYWNDTSREFSISDLNNFKVN